MDTRTKKKHIFISYSRQDRVFVDHLVSNLQNVGIPVWQDVNEISPGSDWKSKITEAVKQASVFLFVASKDSVHSTWMSYELTRFLEEGGKIIPIIIDNIGENDLPFFLRKYQWVDFRTDHNSALRDLIFSLSDEFQPREIIKFRRKKSKGYVFLSYAEEDEDFIEELKKLLKERSYGYWDYNESERDYHTSLFLELESIITEAAAILCILSPSWKLSKWAVKEYFFSIEVGMPVFLLKAETVGPILAVAGEPFIDFVKSTEDGFNKLNKELIRKGL
jgi:hypothetical protein